MDDGNLFALKRIVKVNEGFHRFFERELEILGSIKHRYLVNLRGYCNSPKSKLLIYDFLSGGSLDEALHANVGSLSVNMEWKTGVAAKDWESVARKEKIEGIELQLRKLEDAVRGGNP
ncbi:hypothetical protein ACS0TY_018425 [Phlomoides rotata]